MVAVDGQLYVRAYRGPSSRWFQAAREAGTGTFTAGTRTRAVRLIPTPARPALSTTPTRPSTGTAAPSSPARARAATLRIDPA
jgi:hypothetical protein